MSPHLDDLLCQRYPAIFSERRQSVYRSAMGRGFEVEDGWFHILDALCQQLQQRIEQDSDPQVVASQVKEKFGSLRFRVRTATALQRAMIRLAEEFSTRVCELDGTPNNSTDPRRSP